HIYMLRERGELHVALVDNQVQARVDDRLVGDLREPLPLPVSLEVAELDLVGLQVAVLRLELVVRVFRKVQADRLLPLPESVDPVVERRDLLHETSKLLMIAAYALRSSRSRLGRARGRVREPFAADHPLLRSALGRGHPGHGTR